MKKTMLFILSILMVISFAGCRAINEQNSSFYYEEYEIVKENGTQSVSVKKDNETKTYKKIVKTPIKTETTESESAIENTENKPPKARTFKINDKFFEVSFIETEETGRYAETDRKTNVYHAEDKILRLEYDFITDELLFAMVEMEETDKKITKQEAKKIADDFINLHADISGYTFKEVSENEYEKNYCVIYSKYIDGYYSAQMVSAYVTYDGNIEKYYNESFIFDGIDTNIKIDIKKLDKKLDKELKKVYGKDIEYTASTIIINLEENKELVMRYYVQMQKKDDKTGETVVDGIFASVGIKNNDVRLSKIEAM